MPRKGVRMWVIMALMTALLCVIAPLALPLGVVPVSMSTLVLFLMLYLLPWRQATMATGAYLLLGLLGLPVFSGYMGGVGRLLGPTGGYLLGYLPMVAVAGCLMARSEKRWVHCLCMAAGEVVLYLLGSVWFCIQSGVSFYAAVATCVAPFLMGDAIKIALAVMLGTLLQRRLRQAHVLSW